MRISSVSALSLALLAASAPAHAAETIIFAPGSGLPGGYAAPGAPLVFAGDNGTSVTVTGWSVDYSGRIRSGQLGLWSAGLGVKNSATDNSHTIDNSGWTDFVLLQFGQPVSLGSAHFNTGWQGFRDTDATIGFGILPISDTSSLAGSNWPIPWLTTFGSGQKGNSGDSFRDINPNGESGNIWLIGASFSNPEGGKKLDGFKLESIRFTSAVPEPGTWVLMVIGLGMLGGALRYRRRQHLRVAISF